jgi:hypothetical protein
MLGIFAFPFAAVLLPTLVSRILDEKDHPRAAVLVASLPRLMIAALLCVLASLR